MRLKTSKGIVALDYKRSVPYDTLFEYNIDMEATDEHDVYDLTVNDEDGAEAFLHEVGFREFYNPTEDNLRRVVVDYFDKQGVYFSVGHVHFNG